MLKILSACEKSTKDKTFLELNDIAIKMFGDLSKYFIHSLGHGVGMDIHELPAINSKDKTKPQENIVFTLEPGLYFAKKYGIRIEDTVLFQDGKIRILTKSRKDLVIITKN